MKKIKLFQLLPILAALILQILPIGAVLRFANPEGAPYVHTYSYFDLTPWGYANFGPLLTALSTCVLLLVTLISLRAPLQKLVKARLYLAGIAFGVSLLPFLMGIDLHSLVGIGISLFLLLSYLSVLLPSIKKK